MLSKENRLLKNREFLYLYRKGSFLKSKHFNLFYIKSNRKFTKVGISISKKVGNSVVRSRIKRLYSHAMRDIVNDLKKLNIVILPTYNSLEKSSFDLNKELNDLFQKSKLFK